MKAIESILQKPILIWGNVGATLRRMYESNLVIMKKILAKDILAITLL
jgi:hypothetical protein